MHSTHTPAFGDHCLTILSQPSADRRENWSQRRDYQHRLKASSAGERADGSLVWTFSSASAPAPTPALSDFRGNPVFLLSLKGELKLKGRGLRLAGCESQLCYLPAVGPRELWKIISRLFLKYILRWIFNKALRILKEQGELGHSKMHAGDYK